jgi:hypothetical protein
VLVAAEIGGQRDHPGVDAGHQPIGPASAVAHQQSAGATGQIGHVRAPLNQDQVKAGAQVVPPLSERRDGGVAAAYFERDGGGGESSCGSRTLEQTTAFHGSSPRSTISKGPPGRETCMARILDIIPPLFIVTRAAPRSRALSANIGSYSVGKPAHRAVSE